MTFDEEFEQALGFVAGNVGKPRAEVLAHLTANNKGYKAWAAVKDLRSERDALRDEVTKLEGERIDLLNREAETTRRYDDRLAEVEWERERLRRALEIGQQNSSEIWEALRAMRNSINEHVPMQSEEADLLQGPEASVFCAAVAEAVITALATARAETAAVMEAPIWAVGAIVESATMMGYRMLQVTGGTEAGAIVTGLSAIEKANEGAKVDKPAALRITLDRLTPADATAALDQIRREAEAKGMREAISAAVSEYEMDHCTEGTDEKSGRRNAVRGMMVRLGCYSDFIAEIEKGATE